MTPEELVGRLKEAMPSGLRSVVLYGSAAAGDHLGKVSDYNVLVVADRLGLAELEAISEPAAAWSLAGNRPPILFTIGELARSTDAFPIELGDMKRSHTVLLGDDPVADLAIKSEHLRLQLERELKGKLLDLREAFLLTKGKPKRVHILMIETLPAFLVLCRAALRLYQDDVPARKLDAWSALAQHIACDRHVFLTIHRMREEEPSLLRRVDAAATRALFDTYLRTIEQVVDAVDCRIHSQAKGAGS
jgi:predicted nucleotidyltransferase